MHWPQGLKHLVLTSGATSYPLRGVVLADLRRRWLQDCQDMMDRHEREGTIDAQEYKEGPTRFYRRHILNLGDRGSDQVNDACRRGPDGL